MKEIILTSCFLLLFTACSLPIANLKELTTKHNLQGVKVYFTKSKGKDVLMFIPVIRKISKKDSLIDGAIKELLIGPTKSEELKGIMTEIPIGTRLIKVEESEDEVLIDLSSQFLTGGGSATMQLRYLQLYKTLKSATPDKKLFLNIDGMSIKAIGGEGLEVSKPLMTITDYTKIDSGVSP